MTDHAQRILAQQKQAIENAAMEALEKSAAPLFWMVFIVLSALLLNSAVEGWNQWDSMAAQNEILVQCLNGQTILMGDAVLKCNVYKAQLVAGITQ